MSDKTLVTSALPYVNGPIHLGHMAGAYLPADVYVRYLRLCGQDVLYVCGSDEHGAAIVKKAIVEETTPKAIVDHFHERAMADFAAIGMSFDHYGRTSSEEHHETTQEWFAQLLEAGAFVTKTEELPYDPVKKLYLADRFVKGTCPKCGFEEAYGDQCESCGSTLAPRELKDPKSTLSDATPEWRQTTHWYLAMGDHQDKLEAWIDTKKNWKPNVLGQVRSWLKSGLSDRAMTRDLPWGVPVPEAPAKAAGVDPEGKVLYVWFDAPIGYVSNTREWAKENGDADAWKAYWKDESTRLVHFIGKDNIVFHTLSFPLMLMLTGDYVLPENVPANEFLNLEGKKLSTSRGWAVWLGEACDAFPPDYLRYALLRTLPETKDADFTWRDFQSFVNNELADNIGNFVNRSCQFAAKYFDSKVPKLDGPSEADEAIFDLLKGAPSRIGRAIERYEMREALTELMAVGHAANKYFNDSAPWATRTSDPRLCGNTIHVSLQVCAALSILMDPFLPFTAARLREQLKLNDVRSSGPRNGLTPDFSGEGWSAAERPLLVGGAELGTPQILVSKVEDEAIEAQVKMLEARFAESQAESEPYASLKAESTFDDFVKMDFRVGKVIEAERVKKSKKLIRCVVDLGFETRQILAGVAEHLSADELLGQKVIVVANLAPRKMVGLMSEGMLLMAEDRQGRLVPVTAGSEPGSTVS